METRISPVASQMTANELQYARALRQEFARFQPSEPPCPGFICGIQDELLLTRARYSTRQMVEIAKSSKQSFVLICNVPLPTVPANMSRHTLRRRIDGRTLKKETPSLKGSTQEKKMCHRLSRNCSGTAACKEGSTLDFGTQSSGRFGWINHGWGRRSSVS